MEKEAETLSVSGDLPGWQSKLAELSTVLRTLAPLVRHNNYKHIHSFIDKLILAVNSKGNAQNDLYEEEPSVEPLTVPPVTASCSTPSQPTPKLKPSLDKAIGELEARFLQLKSATPELQASAYLQLSAEINSTCILSQDNSFHVSLTALNTLLQLHGKLADWGKQIFTQCLFRGQFEQAAGLSRFHDLLDDKNLVLALHLGNAKLLAFILQYGDRTLQKRPLVLRDRLYSSPVMACLESHSSKTPMSECFAELLKHGANMLEVDHSGLPVAHTILANLKHPMHKMFLIHSSHTLENPVFMNKLIAALKNRLKSPCCSEEEKKRLNVTISRYSFHLVQAEYFQELMKDLRGQRLVEQMRTFNIEYSDHELQQLLAQTSALETHYLVNCSPEQRKEWIKTSHETHKIAFESYPKIQELLKMVSYEFIRPRQLEQLNQRIVKVTSAIELLNLDRPIMIKRKNQKRPGEAGIDKILEQNKKNSQLLSHSTDLLASISDLLEPGEEDSNGLKQLIRSQLSFFKDTKDNHAGGCSSPASSSDNTL